MFFIKSMVFFFFSFNWIRRHLNILTDEEALGIQPSVVKAVNFEVSEQIFHTRNQDEGMQENLKKSFRLH